MLNVQPCISSEWPASTPTEAGDAATDSNGGLRDICQVDIGEFDRTDVQEGVRGHQPDPGSCHAG